MTIQKLNKNNHLPTTTVIDYENKTDDLRIIWLKKPANFDFTPGQYCTIGKNKIEQHKHKYKINKITYTH